MRVFSDVTVAAMDDDAAGYRLAERVSIVIKGNRIIWGAAAADLPASYDNALSCDLEGRFVTPGLIDCHLRRS
ncbi:hypothetical protein [Brucella sp. 2280]|uniref:hypothetical protein n=1 Tax=Brucella sp. 2280 TaxID=2592625 RepID=UPI0018861855|nr:hypothetical protein [Brucella sp. 2280]